MVFPNPRLCQALVDRLTDRAHIIETDDAAAPARSDLAPFSFAELAKDLQTVWSAPTTDARLKKRIVRTVIHEAVADLDDDISPMRLAISATLVNARFQRASSSPATKRFRGSAASY